MYKCFALCVRVRESRFGASFTFMQADTVWIASYAREGSYDKINDNKVSRG
jgi:hypothetical protein